MATAMKTPPSGMTGAVRSLQWTIQDLNGSVEHLGQSHDHLRRAQNIMAWTTAIFGALLLSGLVWIANDIFHLKDQMTETDRRFDGIEAQMATLGTRLDDLNLTIEQVGAELLASRQPGAAGPEVSVLSTPAQSANVQAAAAPLETTTNGLDAAVAPATVPQPVNAAPQATVCCDRAGSSAFSAGACSGSTCDRCGAHSCAITTCPPRSADAGRACSAISGGGRSSTCGGTRASSGGACASSSSAGSSSSGSSCGRSPRLNRYRRRAGSARPCGCSTGGSAWRSLG